MSQSSVTTHKPAAASKSLAVSAPYLDSTAWAFLGLLAAAFLSLFYRWFWIQGQLSAAAPADWGHVFVVPLISGFVVWRHRADLARARVMTFWPAVAPLLLAIMAYFFCVVGIKNHMLQGLTIILALFSATLLVLGPALMRYLFLPIAFLVFAITVAEMIMLRITFPLQLSASYGAYALLSVFGIPFNFDVTLSGNAIELFQNGKSFPLNVAEACSGMRMVIAFLALAGCVALLQTKVWWQRMALLLLGPNVKPLADERNRLHLESANHQLRNQTDQHKINRAHSRQPHENVIQIIRRLLARANARKERTLLAHVFGDLV